MKKVLLAGSIAVLAIFSGFQLAQAGTYVYDFTKEFSGGTGPTGSLTATVEDIVGGVKLTLNAGGLGDKEYVDKWYFNFNTNLNLNAYKYAKDASPTVNTVNLGENSYQADGDSDGKYDGMIDFLNSNDDNRFDAGKTFSITFFADQNHAISANDFEYDNGSTKKGGPFYMAAHICSIGTNSDDSGWVGVLDPPSPAPEPATVLLLGTGVAGLTGMVRRRRAKNRYNFDK